MHLNLTLNSREVFQFLRILPHLVNHCSISTLSSWSALAMFVVHIVWSKLFSILFAELTLTDLTVLTWPMLPFVTYPVSFSSHFSIRRHLHFTCFPSSRNSIVRIFQWGNFFCRIWAASRPCVYKLSHISYSM